MDIQKRSLQFGTMMLVFALTLRAFSGGIPAAAVQRPELLSLLFFAETGWMLTPPTGEPAPTEPAVPTQPEETLPPESSPPETVPAPPTAQFSPTDADSVQIKSVCGYQADALAMLQQPLTWELTGQTPTVLILHSHATEGYTNTEGYAESAGYRTLDTQYNVVSVGDRIAQALEAGGIHVLHDTALHDYPSYSDAYANSRQSASAYIQQYPSVKMILDIHRDAVETPAGEQMQYTVQQGQERLAQMMLVVGSDAGGLTHPDWSQNMALAVKLHAQLEKQVPGICRPINLRTQRFNQDLSPGALLIEIGAAGNTRQEALAAADVLAQAILALAHGAQIV